MKATGISGRGYPMLLRLRLVVGLTLLLTVIAGSFEPALASPLSQARPALAFANTVWVRVLKWWNGVIAPGSKVATNSGYGGRADAGGIFRIGNGMPALWGLLVLGTTTWG